MPGAPQRIWIVGIAGSGKTTLARRIAAGAGVPHVELDDLFWEPGWRQAPPDQFVDRVTAATAGGSWVASGNYLRRLGPILLARTELVVWLDTSFPRAVARVQRRTFHQARTGEPFCNGNRNTYRHLWTADGPFRSMVKRGRGERRRYLAQIRDPSGPEWVRLRSADAADAWAGAVRQG